MKRYVLRTPKGAGPLQIDYAKALNPQQLDVVQHGDGAALVLAGAGSGKTRTLVYRVAWLIEHGIPREQILLVTFTNKAALEMKNRVESLLKGSTQGLWSGTFHHVGNRILRMYGAALGYDRGFSILDDDDSRALIRGLMGKPEKGTVTLPKPDVLQDIISFAASSQQPVRDLIRQRFPRITGTQHDALAAIADQYQQKKRQLRAMDFDDLLVRWLELLTAKPVIAERLSRQFRYILVDEYQDTNHIQASIVERLAATHGNLLVVGDDCQSIYSFRAAHVGNILEFPKRFPKSRIFKLETNYRSTPQILAVANTTIAGNPAQFPKQLRPVRTDGMKPALVVCQDSYQQAAFIVQRVQDLTQQDGRSFRDLAVLVRSTYQSIEIELELNKHSIPYVVRGGLRFFEQAHVKDVVSHLKICANPRDELAWLRVLGLYTGIGPSTAAKIWSQASDAANLAEALTRADASPLTSRSSQGWQSARRALTKVSGLPDGDIAGMLRAVLETGYDRYLDVSFENADERREDLEQLVNFASQYTSLEQFLADVTLSESFRGERGHDAAAGEDLLVLSTIHQAKGLEWPVVFVPGLVEGGLPHYRAQQSDEDLAEERRLFYVAVTRAADELYLLYPIISSSFRTGTSVNHASTFLEELDDTIVERWELTPGGEAGERTIQVDGDGDVISRIRNL